MRWHSKILGSKMISVGGMPASSVNIWSVYILLPYVQWCQPVLLHQMLLQPLPPHTCAPVGHGVKTSFPFFKRNRIDDTLPLYTFESGFYHTPLVAINHNRHLWLCPALTSPNAKMFHGLSLSSKPSSIFTSMICAPASTCCLATANASVYFPSRISLQTFCFLLHWCAPRC